MEVGIILVYLTLIILLRRRGPEANLRRESSVVPQVERYQTLRSTASASCLLDVCRREYELHQLWSSFSVSQFLGKPFVAIKLVAVGTAVR